MNKSSIIPAQAIPSDTTKELPLGVRVFTIFVVVATVLAIMAFTGVMVWMFYKLIS